MRADTLLVEQGHFSSRAAARAAIEAGCVMANGAPVTRASQKLNTNSLIKAQPAHPYVSRGGLKLAHALDVFGIDPAGRDCLDIGASTGGFTDVLLQRGAAHVVAVDVGRGQLHERMASNARVSALEATDARCLSADRLRSPPSLLVCDASFIALEKLLDVPLSLAADEADFIGLFKPQFQVGRAHIGRGGIVTDLEAAGRAAEAFSDWMTKKGWPIREWTASPIKGGSGNAERLFRAVRA